MRKLLLLLVIGLMFATCKNDEISKSRYAIVGSVQKGPFVLGSNITIQELDGNLNPVGNVYNTITNDDAGHFKMGSLMTSNYIEIIASGYYFDEVIGEVSQGTLVLRSITDLDNSSVANVNLLTTLVAQRITKLVNKGDTISKATEQAERELFVSLGLSEKDIPNVRSSQMDISENGDHNALLLAISVVLQFERTAGEISELIAKLATDLADDGVISQDKVQSLYINKSIVEVLTLVRNNLMYRYSSLGLECNIPEFDKYIAYFLDVDNDGNADKNNGVITDCSKLDIDAKGFEGDIMMQYLDIDNYDVIADCNWIKIQSVDIDKITIFVEKNLHEQDRTA